MYVIFHVTSSNHVFNGSCDYGWNFLTVSYDPFKSGDHRHRDSGDIMLLIFLEISHDHVTQGTFEFVVGTCLVVSKHCYSTDMFSIIHVILQEHFIG